jgi:hypothetical protein
MSNEDFQEMCRTIHQAILGIAPKYSYSIVVTDLDTGTDMMQHFKIVENLEAKVQLDPPFTVQPNSRIDLVVAILHCADLSGQTQNRNLAGD